MTYPSICLLYRFVCFPIHALSFHPSSLCSLLDGCLFWSSLSVVWPLLFSVFIVFYSCRTFYFTLYRCFNPLHIGSFWQWSSSASHSQRAKYAPISSVYLAGHRTIANYACNGRTRPPKGVFVGRFDSVYIHPNNSRCLHITVGCCVVKQLPLFDRSYDRSFVCIRQPEDGWTGFD